MCVYVYVYMCMCNRREIDTYIQTVRDLQIAALDNEDRATRAGE
jgi:hypothetical protein